MLKMSVEKLSRINISIRLKIPETNFEITKNANKNMSLD